MVSWQVMADTSGDGGLLLPRADQAVFVGQDDGLDAVTQAQFCQHPPNVGFDRGVTYDQLGGDFGVGQPAGDEGEDLAFSAGQGVQRRRCDGGVGAGGELADQPTGDRRGDQRLAPSRCARGQAG